MPVFRRYAIYAVVAILVALYCLGLDAEPRNDSHSWRMVIAGVAGVLVVGMAVAHALAEQYRAIGVEVVRNLMVV